MTRDENRKAHFCTPVIAGPGFSFLAMPVLLSIKFVGAA